MNSVKFMVALLLSISIISCKSSNDLILENEKMTERIKERMKDSLRLDSIHKNEWNAKSKDSIVEDENSSKYLLGLSDLITIYSTKEIDYQKILSSLKKINSKWKMFDNGTQTSNENYYFIFSLEDKDINKSSVVSFDYKSNILQYDFYDKGKMQEIYKELIKNKFVLYSEKKVERGDVVSYMSDEYNISIRTIDSYTTPNTKDYTIYLMRR